MMRGRELMVGLMAGLCAVGALFALRGTSPDAVPGTTPPARPSRCAPERASPPSPQQARDAANSAPPTASEPPARRAPATPDPVETVPPPAGPVPAPSSDVSAPRKETEAADGEVRVTGQVVDAEGRPIPGVGLEVWVSVNSLPLRAGPDGSFLASIPAGRYGLRVVDADGWLDPLHGGLRWLHTDGDAGRVVLHAAPAETAAGSAAPIELPVEAETSVAGRVYGPAGEPLAGAFVAWLDPSLAGPAADLEAVVETRLRRLLTRPPGADRGNGALALSRVDADGGYRLEGLPTGSVRLLALAPGASPAARGLSLEPGEAATLDFELRAGGSLVGQLLDPDGRPLPRPTLAAYGPRDAVARTDADLDGRFALHGLAPGAHRLVASAPGAGSVVVGATVEPGQTTEITLRFERCVEVRGRVTVDGLPAEDFALLWVDAEEVVAARARTDASGAFVTLGLQPGTYHVHLEGPGARAVELVELPAGALHAVHLELRSDALREPVGALDP